MAAFAPRSCRTPYVTSPMTRCFAVTIDIDDGSNPGGPPPMRRELLHEAGPRTGNPNGPPIVRIGSGRDEEVTQLVHTVVKPGFIDEYRAWTECVRGCLMPSRGVATPT